MPGLPAANAGAAAPCSAVAQRGAFLVRLVGFVPVVASIHLVAAPVHHSRLYLLSLVWTLVTAASARSIRRNGLAPRQISALSALDFGLLLAIMLTAQPSIVFALPAFSLLSYLQCLLWGCRGGLAAALLSLLAAVVIGLTRATSVGAEAVALALWAAQNTTAVLLLGAYAERQKRLVGDMERRGHALQREAERQAEMAVRDPLTGLYNRRFLEARMAEEVARARRSLAPLSLAVIDVDFLKQWNDNHGHAAGDAAIRTLAKLLAEAARAGDVIARVGGEEFVLLAPHTDAAGLRALVERVRVAAGRAEVWDARGPVKRPLTFSAGVAPLGPLDDGASLVEAADLALYAAKRGGRDRVVIAERGSVPAAAETP